MTKSSGQKIDFIDSMCCSHALRGDGYMASLFFLGVEFVYIFSTWFTLPLTFCNLFLVLAYENVLSCNIFPLTGCLF